MKRAIITGATGAIGTALVKELVNNNVEVLVFARKESNRLSNIIKNRLVKIKYCALDEICLAKNDEKLVYDVFYHLAWEGSSGTGRNDKSLQEKNIDYAVDAVRCAKRFGCSKFVGVGSQAEYGIKTEPLTPNMTCEPKSEYGKAKLEAGRKTKAIADLLGIKHNWVRVLSVFGPNDNENSLISYVIKQIKNNETLDLTKGEQIWDYLYSEDAARALFLVGERGVNGKTYVLGSGDKRKLKEYIEEIKTIFSSNSILNFGKIPYYDNQAMYLVADISEITNDIGWKPITSFSDGIRKLK